LEYYDFCIKSGKKEYFNDFLFKLCEILEFIEDNYRILAKAVTLEDYCPFLENRVYFYLNSQD
jgi:hypothetical protein